MTRVALGLAGLIAGCSVPTPVGQLESAVETTGASTSTGSTTAPQTDTTADGATTSSATASGSSDSSSGGASTPTMTAFAIPWGDIPESSGAQDPDALHVVLGFTTATCEDVFPSDPCETWDVSFTLDPAQQVEGSYDEFEVNAIFTEQLADDGVGCPFGGGTFEATIVIESIDPSGVQVRLDGVGFGVEQFDLEGFSVFAPRC